MRIFKNRYMNRYAAKQGITDADLREAVQRADNGLIDADLGSGVIKQRIARQGQGKSSGYRSIILFKQGDRAFFVYCFAKNDRDNIDRRELAEMKELATTLLAYTPEQIGQALLTGALTEIEP